MAGDADDGDRPDADSVVRYEQVRAAALGLAPPAHPHGLAILERRGVVAWMRAWHALTAPGDPRPDPEAHSGRAPGPEVVSVLASMALACVGGGGE